MHHLKALEAESIFFIREALASFSKPVILFSIGKDSMVLLHLVMKAVYPSKIPVPILHIDTGWKFSEMISFREQIPKLYDVELITHSNYEAMENGVNPFDYSSQEYTHIMKTTPLKDAIDKYGFDAAFGGARRDEEKSRSKERIFSFRGVGQTWDPRNQRPELWRLFNNALAEKQTARIFPLSNWTERDVWDYIKIEGISVVSLYFAKLRKVIERDEQLIMLDDLRFPLDSSDVISEQNIRFRTLGCYPLTAAMRSNACNLEQLIEEISLSRFSERQGRLIDRDEIGSMEKKKKDGYF